jgi:hypothetical protein
MGIVVRVRSIRGNVTAAAARGRPLFRKAFTGNGHGGSHVLSAERFRTTWVQTSEPMPAAGCGAPPPLHGRRPGGLQAHCRRLRLPLARHSAASSYPGWRFSMPRPSRCPSSKEQACSPIVRQLRLGDVRKGFAAASSEASALMAHRDIESYRNDKVIVILTLIWWRCWERSATLA